MENNEDTTKWLEETEDTDIDYEAIPEWVQDDTPLEVPEKTQNNFPEAPKLAPPIKMDKEHSEKRQEYNKKIRELRQANRRQDIYETAIQAAEQTQFSQRHTLINEKIPEEQTLYEGERGWLLLSNERTFPEIQYGMGAYKQVEHPGNETEQKIGLETKFIDQLLITETEAESLVKNAENTEYNTKVY